MSAKNTLHINFMGTSGSGKTTCANMLFSTLKKKGHNVEISKEYAAEVCVREEWHTSQDQVTMLAEQYRRAKIYDGKFDIVINDYSLLLPIVYGELQDRASTKTPEFQKLCLDIADEFNHINIVMTSRNLQEDASRNNTATYNDKIQDKLYEVLERYSVPLMKYDWAKYDQLLELIKESEFDNPEQLKTIIENHANQKG